MNPDSASLTKALQQFADADEGVRAEAFARIEPQTRSYLHSTLARRLPRQSDQEDVIQDVLQKIWRAGDRVVFSAPGAYWRYVRTLARNCTIDHVRGNESTLNVDDHDFGEIQPSESEQVDLLVEAMEDRRKLYRLADEVFLALPESMSERRRNRHVLASKLFLIDKEPWHEVCRIVNSGVHDHEWIGRSDLDKILIDSSVLLQLAYSELFWDNSRLTDFLLEGLQADGVSPEADEFSAVKMRFQYAMLFEPIANRMESRLKKEELSALFDSCTANFPFIGIMSRLLKDVSLYTDARALFQTAGLWNRLVFQYHSHCALPHRDIFSRTAPPAEVVDYEITLEQLNTNLSKGRLWKKLAKHLERSEK